MDTRVTSFIGMMLLFLATAVAAEPPARNTSAPKTAPGVAKPGTFSPAPLKLHVGDVRQYMMPSEFAAAVNAPDTENDTVVVEGSRQKLLPLKSMQPVAPGIIAPFWAVAHPTQAWRILVPDLNAPASGPPSVVPRSDYLCLSANGDCGR